MITTTSRAAPIASLPAPLPTLLLDLLLGVYVGIIVEDDHVARRGIHAGARNRSGRHFQHHRRTAEECREIRPSPVQARIEAAIRRERIPAVRRERSLEHDAIAAAAGDYEIVATPAPRMTSLPPKPLMMSLPLPPLIVSATGDPPRISLPAPPVMVRLRLSIASANMIWTPTGVLVRPLASTVVMPVVSIPVKFGGALLSVVEIEEPRSLDVGHVDITAIVGSEIDLDPLQPVHRTQVQRRAALRGDLDRHECRRGSLSASPTVSVVLDACTISAALVNLKSNAFSGPLRKAPCASAKSRPGVSRKVVGAPYDVLAEQGRSTVRRDVGDDLCDRRRVFADARLDRLVDDRAERHDLRGLVERNSARHHALQRHGLIKALGVEEELDGGFDVDAGRLGLRDTDDFLILACPYEVVRFQF